MYKKLPLWKKQRVNCCTCKDLAQYAHIEYPTLFICEKCYEKLGEGINEC